MTLTISEEFYGFNFSISINHADFQAVHGQSLTEGLGGDEGGKCWPKLSLLYPSYSLAAQGSSVTFAYTALLKILIFAEDELLGDDNSARTQLKLFFSHAVS